MSYPLAIAAVLAVAIGAAHSVLGERFIIGRLLRRSDLPTLYGSDIFTRRTIRFAWHLTTIAWLGLAVVLLILAHDRGAPPSTDVIGRENSPARSIGMAIAIAFLVTAAVTAVSSRFKHFAWPVFTAIGVLTWIGVG